MAAVQVLSAEHTTRELLGLEYATPIPQLVVEDDPDPDRKLSVFVPLDPFQATVVEYEETPTYLNTSRTKFICRPPFDGRRPPRFVFYFPYDDRVPINREMFMSVVSENEPFECDAKSRWTVLSMDAPPATLASGLMVQQGERSITILDATRTTEVKFSWPNHRIRLERSAPFRTGVGDDEVLLGHCPAGMPFPVGMRYSIPECLSARISYTFSVRRVSGDDETPEYISILQRQYLVTNASDVNFPRVRHITIATETTTTSLDGHPTRAFQADVQSASSSSSSVTRPLTSLREIMATIPARSTHILTEVVPAPRECAIVGSVTEVPTAVGQYATLSFDMWIPTETARACVVQPAPAQIHVENGIPFFDDVAGTLFWQPQQAELAAKWMRVRLPEPSAKIAIQCINVQTRRNSHQAAISVFSYFSKPMLLAFPVYPNQFDVCSRIDEISGARQVYDLPWMDSASGAQLKVFVLNNRGEPISFRATVLSSK